MKCSSNKAKFVSSEDHAARGMHVVPVVCIDNRSVREQGFRLFCTTAERESCRSCFLVVIKHPSDYCKRCYQLFLLIAAKKLKRTLKCFNHFDIYRASVS